MKMQCTSMMMVCTMVLSTGTSCRSPVGPSPHGMVQEGFCQHPVVGIEMTMGDGARDGLTADELARLKNMNNHLACNEVGLCWEEH